MKFETGLFLNKIPYIKSGKGLKTMVFFYGGSAMISSLEKSSIKDHLDILKVYVPEGYTYYVFGYEQNPVRGYDLDQIADDFAQIIKDKIGQAVIVGISFGGFVAMRFAAKYPELTDKLVLLVSAHKFSSLGARKIHKMMELAENERYYDLIKEFSILFRRAWLNLLARFILWKNKKRTLKDLNPGPSIRKSLAGTFSTDIYRNIDYLGKIKAKTLVIGGTKDQFFGVEEFSETAERIRGAKLQLFAQETHMLPIERKKDAAKIIKAFVH
jgi:pimeloyl-ACP methyl ester carboxylesterase